MITVRPPRSTQPISDSGLTMLRGKMTEQVRARLAEFGVREPNRLIYCSRLLDEKGEAALWGYCKRQKEGRDSLRQFAQMCEQQRTFPAHDDLSIAERQQYELFRNKLRAVKYKPAPLPEHAVVVYSSLLGLKAIRDVFGSPPDNVFHLNQEEFSHFFRDLHADEDPWWFTIRWWILNTGEEASRNHASLPTLPDESEYWELVEGGLSGSLSGGATRDLWIWDGERLERVEGYVCMDTY